MADPDGARILTAAGRHASVVRVLRRVLVLNLGVAVAKIALGSLTGAVSILSDGFHSLTDAASNVVALIGVSAAQRPPDADHPYGHRKYETMASLAILVFMIVVLVQIVETATGRLRNATASTPTVLPASLAMMLVTLVVNILVVRYEVKEGRRLNSQILGADAKHTRSDVWTTSAVLAALLGVWLGYPRLDALAGLVVAIFIGHASWQIARDASGVLADHIVIPEEEIRSIVDPTPGVIGCEKIRTRGPADNVFVDLHLWINGGRPLAEAHAISHIVKDRLMRRFPQVADVVIHIEPPTLANPKAQIPNPKSQRS